MLKSNIYRENLKDTKIKFVIYTIYYGINKIYNVLYIKYVICNESIIIYIIYYVLWENYVSCRIYDIKNIINIL